MEYSIKAGDLDFSPVFNVLLKPFFDIFYTVLFTSLSIFLAFIIYALLKYRINLLRLDYKKLIKKRIKLKLLDFIRWVYIDIKEAQETGENFDLYGFTMYCGDQGGGKTTSMIEWLNRMHKRFPKALIVTNFKYKYAYKQMESWRDFFDIRNGTDGVIFAIDEIHSEFSTANSKDFPESLLSEISQQRKQRIKIVGTSQVYSRVAKPIREQCFSVVQCVTYLHRWTFTREYNSYDVEQYPNLKQLKKKARAIRRYSFVQSNALRKCFDTYEKIERLKNEVFMERMEH